jgi:poly(U)-specific endoribonuclease
LPKNSVQLSNKGGEIRLVNPLNQTVHRVSYSKAQASREGETILF